PLSKRDDDWDRQSNADLDNKLRGWLVYATKRLPPRMELPMNQRVISAGALRSAWAFATHEAGIEAQDRKLRLCEICGQPLRGRRTTCGGSCRSQKVSARSSHPGAR
ncbi:MAG: hypothetical protein KC766_39980, partial [Myxococcales bacterium]|nr:hypothetical protein [Myxococcales bacterium]